MKYAYAALILNETGEEINERNLTAVLEAAGADVIESRTKALVAALENVDLDAATDGDSPVATDEPDDVEALASAGDGDAASSPDSGEADEA